MFNDNLINEFINIYDLLEQNNIIEIYDKYPYINKIILDFIKSKNIIWFKKLFVSIKNNWCDDSNLLNVNLSKIPDFNVQLREYICANIFISFVYKYGQEQCCNNFKQILQHKCYWGMIIAPTGWGKSYTHILLFGLYFQANIKNVMLITKRKDILTDQINNDNMNTKIKLLQRNNLFPKINYIIDEYIDNINFTQLNANTHKIIIINIDKIINNYNKIKWKQIGMIIFDEMHWSGANKIHTALLHIKKYVPYCIGSSATPMRIDKTNQTNIKELFTNKLYELSYIDAWKHNVIVPITTILIKINDYQIVIPDTPSNTDKKYKSKTYAIFDKKGKIKILQKLKYYYDEKSIYKKVILYFRSRKSLLEWYKFIIPKYFVDATKYISFSYTKTDTICEIINALQIQYKDIDNGIINFKNAINNALLFVVDRATEGFDDNKVDICCDMDYIVEHNTLKTMQKMGRCQRIEAKKIMGYYLCPIACASEDTYKKQIAHICNNYINYVTQYATQSKFTKCDIKYITLNLIKTFKYETHEEYNHDELLSDMNCLNYSDKQQQFNELKNTVKNMFYNKKDYIKYAQQNKLPCDPHIEYSAYWRGWYDFMGIDTTQFITYTKWNDLYAKITNIKQYEKLCKYNKNIPLYPNEIYTEYEDANNNRR